MSLDENQLAMINTLIYQEDFSSVYKQCVQEREAQSERQATSPTMGEVLDHMKGGTSSDDYLSDSEYETLIDTMASDPEISDLTLRDFTQAGEIPGHAPSQSREDYRQTGVNLTLSDGDTGDLYIVYKGTQDGVEWQDNFEGLLETDTDCQLRAAAYADLMIERYGTDEGMVIVSGHSKGGNKAAYTAVTNERVDKCYSFDGQGFSSNFHQKYATQVAERKDKIYAYNYEGDFVSSLLISVAGTTVFTTSSQDGEGLGFLNNYVRGDASFLPSNHAPISLFESSSSLTLKDGGAPKDYWETINDFTMWITNNVPERYQRKLVEALSGLMGGGDALDYIEDHPEEFGVLVGVLADYPEFEKLLRELAGSDLDLSSYLGNPFAAGPVHVGANALISLLVQLLHNEGLRDFTAKGLLGLMGADVSDEWVEAFGSASDGVRQAIASGERGREAVLVLQIEPRDWSDARKQELLEVVKAVDSEPLYDFTRWDVTYRLQDFGAWLGLWDCEQNIDEIVRRQIDLNNVHKQEIEDAFEQAAEIDEEYASSLSGMPDGIREATTLLEGVLSA